MSDATLITMQFLQYWPWPIALTLIAWFASTGLSEHSKRMAAELTDANFLEAKRESAQAARDVQLARDAWEAATATTTEEMSQIKSALINRGTI